jgi:hypothetical protein
MPGISSMQVLPEEPCSATVFRALRGAAICVAHTLGVAGHASYNFNAAPCIISNGIGGRASLGFLSAPA